jgi:hypothetical protein
LIKTNRFFVVSLPSEADIFCCWAVRYAVSTLGKAVLGLGQA